jgi:hypothetical protein
MHTFTSGSFTIFTGHSLDIFNRLVLAVMQSFA